MDELTTDYFDESRTMSVDSTQTGDKNDVEFIRVNHNVEAQLNDEIGHLADHFMSGAYNSLEDGNGVSVTAHGLEPMVKVKTGFVINFINAVRKTPVLWKKDTPGYKHPHAIQKAWNTLSQQFGISAQHLKEKWILLRSQFRSNYTAMEQKRAKGLSRKDYQPTWFAFEAMRFLRESPDDVVAAETVTVTPEITEPVVVNEILYAEESPKNITCAEDIDSHDVVLALIDHVKSTPVLWDTSDTNYKNQIVQSSEWHRIAKLLQFPVETVKQKWQMLRAQFRGNINKMKNQAASKAFVRPPMWYGFEPMRFLLKGKSVDYLNLSSKPKPETVNQPMPKPIPRIARRVSLRPKAVERKKVLVKKCPVSREIKRPSTSATVKSVPAPKVMRIIPYSSSRSATRAIPPFRSPFSVSEIDPLIARTFQNLSQITDKIAQTETSPYNGLVNHLSLVLSRKRASDFNEIEGVLLNCLNELNKFPNEGKAYEPVVPRVVVKEYNDRNDEDEEKESD